MSYINVGVAAREVLFNDGEGLVYDDFNLAQRLAKKEALDFLAPALCRGAATGADIETAGLDTSNLWTPPGHAAPDAGPIGSAVAMKSSNHFGWIFFQSGSGMPGSATDYEGRAVFVATDALLTLHDPCDPSSDRYDLIALKLDITSTDADGNTTSETRDFEDATTHALTSQPFVKRRKVTLNKSVTKGIPGAGFPATPSGYIPWAIVKIPAAFSGTFDPSLHIIDYRMPMGSFGQYLVPAHQAYIKGGWTIQNGTGGGTLKANAPTDVCYFPLPPIANGRRLLNVQASVSGTPTLDIVVRDLTQFPPTDSTIGFNVGLNHSFSQPLWLNGGGAERAGGNLSIWVKVTANAGTDQISFVRWAVA
jgi:hypothetical protein